MENNITSGDRVRQLRKHLGLTQEAFSETIGMTHGNVSKIEKNDVSLSNTFLNAIKISFAGNPDWIKTGEGEMFITTEEYIANGINFLGVQKYGESLVKILNDPQFAELQTYVSVSSLVKESLSSDLKELLQQVLKIWHQGDERTKQTLVQFVRAFPEAEKNGKK